MSASSSSSPSEDTTPVAGTTAPVRGSPSSPDSVNAPRAEGEASISGAAAHHPPPLLQPRHRILASRAAHVPRDLEADRALRRSLISGLPKARRHHDPNQIEICLPPGFLAESIRTNPSTGPLPLPRPYALPTPHVFPETQSIQGLLPLPNPVTLLGAGRVDPFVKYPIETTAIDHWILDQLHSSPDPALRTFRESWMPIAVNDPAVFHQLLASSAWRIRKIRGDDPNNNVSLAHHSLALRTVNKNLSDPEHAKSDYAVAGVTILVCYSIVNDDFRSFSTHLDGLARLIEMRGGFEAIEQNTMLRRIVFSVDVSGGSRQDMPPRFPLPKKFLHAYKGSRGDSSVPITNTFAPWRLMFQTGHPLLDIFDELLVAVEYARNKVLRNEIWIRVDFATLYLDPISWKLLSLGTNVDEKSTLGIIQEATRLGIMLFFGEIRRKCGALAVSTLTPLKKHKELMSRIGCHVDWSRSESLLLWGIFFGFFESWQQPEYDWYVSALAHTALKLGLETWDQVVATVRSFLWISPIHDERLGKFRESYTSEMNGLIGSSRPSQ